jgi:hypothetical protein
MADMFRHWLVFWASLATVLTTFGIVPVQAGIFSTGKVVQIHPQDFVISQKYIHSSEQERDLTISYARSAYGILELNDTLPAYMTAEYTLAPFTASGLARQPKGTWIANTTLYSLDVHCEEGRPTIDSDSERPACISSDGCSVVDGDFNNQTIGDLPLLNSGVFPNPHIHVKTFSAVHLGRHNYDDGCYYGERREWVSLDSACSTGFCLLHWERHILFSFCSEQSEGGRFIKPHDDCVLWTIVLRAAGSSNRGCPHQNLHRHCRLRREASLDARALQCYYFRPNA